MPPRHPHIPVRIFVSGPVFFQLKGFQEDLATAGKCAGVGLEQIGQFQVQRVWAGNVRGS